MFIKIVSKDLMLFYEFNHQDVQAREFEKYCWDTADLYVNNYGWYPMLESSHFVLIHGPEIVKSFEIPIVLLSEEDLS